MRITKIVIKSEQKIPFGKFTVLVGPNNVGKSQTLKDIHARMTGGPNAKTVIIKNIELERPEKFDDLLDGLTVVEDPQNVGLHFVRGIGSNLTSGENLRVDLESLRRQFESASNLTFTFGNIGKFRVSYLDAGSRLQVTQQAPSHNPHLQPPQNLLQGLFSSKSNVEEVLRSAFKSTFGMDILLDYSGMTQLTLRVGKEFGEIPSDPRDAYPILSKFNRIDEQGDGYRSFVGVVLSLLLSRGRIVLLDEPEAFLHPAQARQLGYWIAEHASSVPGQIIVATHNPNFLAGILSADQPVDIFRLNRTEDTTTYTRISPEATSNLSKSPLLSSQRVLEAIFFKGVAVCEADADRAIYQTVATQTQSNQDVLFLHAHNKQSISKVVCLLRAAEIPTCAITDLDVINSSEDIENILKCLGATEQDIATILDFQRKIANEIITENEAEILKSLQVKLNEFLQQLKKGEHTLSGARGALNRLRKQASNWSIVKSKGIDGLNSDTKKTAHDLLDLARRKGLFIVPVGELEGWMDLGTSRKNKWIVLALEELHQGNCPEPLKDFVDKIVSYLLNETSQQGAAADRQSAALLGGS